MLNYRKADCIGCGARQTCPSSTRVMANYCGTGQGTNAARMHVSLAECRRRHPTVVRPRFTMADRVARTLAQMDAGRLTQQPAGASMAINRAVQQYSL
jgi:hypothetical protein